MKVAFTICSNNYYAQALTLMQSCKRHSPDFLRVVVIVDQRSSYINYSEDIHHIFIHELPIDVDDLVSKYDIIELNTSIKASVFLFLIKKYNDVETIHYFDPDIKLFTPISKIEDELGQKNILITPHILTSIKQNNGSPQDQLFLNHGIYNLGYIGVRVTERVIEFLKWWEQKTLLLGYNRLEDGLFVDQLWINFVPIFYYNETVVSLHPGLNIGPWNLHERTIEFKNQNFYINNLPLLFFHFSSYSVNKPDVISKPYSYTFDQMSPDLKLLYNEYHKDLVDNHIHSYSQLKCELYQSKVNEESKETFQKEKFKTVLRDILPPVIARAIKKI